MSLRPAQRAALSPCQPRRVPPPRAARRHRWVSPPPPPPLARSLRAAVPIYATSSFVFDSSAHGADLFALRAFGNIYSRIMNPTNVRAASPGASRRVARCGGGVALG